MIGDWKNISWCLTPCISTSCQLIVTMVTELATVIIMTKADYADDDKDEDKNGGDGDTNDIVMLISP